MKFINKFFIDFLFLSLSLLFFIIFIYISSFVPETFMMYFIYGGFCLSFYFSYLLRKRFLKKK